MKVTTVSASVRFSKALGDGQHKTVELGAEGVVASLTESWQEAQAQLYAELSQQLKALWGNGNGNHKAEIGAVVAAEALPEPEPIQKADTDTSPTTGALLPGAPGRVQETRERHSGLVLTPAG